MYVGSITEGKVPEPCMLLHHCSSQSAARLPWEAGPCQDIQISCTKRATSEGKREKKAKAGCQLFLVFFNILNYFGELFFGYTSFFFFFFLCTELFSTCGGAQTPRWAGSPRIPAFALIKRETVKEKKNQPRAPPAGSGRGSKEKD